MQLYGSTPIHSHSFAPGEEAATKDFPATIQIIVGAEFAPPVIDKLISLGCVIHGDHKDLERHTETMPAMFGGGRLWGASAACALCSDDHGLVTRGCDVVVRDRRRAQQSNLFET